MFQSNLSHHFSTMKLPSANWWKTALEKRQIKQMTHQYHSIARIIQFHVKFMSRYHFLVFLKQYPSQRTSVLREVETRSVYAWREYWMTIFQTTRFAFDYTTGSCFLERTNVPFVLFCFNNNASNTETVIWAFHHLWTLRWENLEEKVKIKFDDAAKCR